MIYRVGDGDNPAYDYSSQLKPAKNAESQEKFSLDRQKEQDVPKKKEEKGEDKKLHQKPGVDIRPQGGVKLELSGGRVTEREQRTERASKSESAGGGLFDAVLSIFKGLFEAVGDFFYKVWNDPPPEAVSEDVTPEEAERYTEEYYAMKGIPRPENAWEREKEEISASEDLSKAAEKVTESVNEQEEKADFEAKQAERDEKIRKHLRSGNLEQVISLLTDDGRRPVAKNSTLLTYYDKNGKLTQLSASDRERILHGDRHVRTL
ncbi:MAG: hypothetical protein K2M20_13490 [Lachnospiraceae bacterium]|nr:hypothetical protein [Lachnospiraceae bacterium]